ncbi:hypothetical protein IWQ61_009237 [Dispira simplex]|nr:hypothetical protein IWQ61_009237 [Dispira simplex]
MSLYSNGVMSAKYDTPLPIHSVGFNLGKLVSQPDAAIDAKEIFIHNQFNSTDEMDNNIALVRRVPNVTIDGIDVRNPVRIYSDAVKVGDQFQVAGMGVTDFKGAMESDRLQAVTFTVADSKECHLGNTHYQSPDGSQICTTAQEGQGACQGDSGGPLCKVGSEGGQSVLVGLISFGVSSDLIGPRCSAPDTLTYFTHIFKYTGWISHYSGFPVDQFLDGS